MAWNPNHYLKFGANRLRPAVDLLNKSVDSFPDPSKVKRVLDLGCGPGNVTELLCKAFPNAQVEGIDSSVEMIESAWKVNKNSKFKENISFRVGTVEEVANSSIAEKYDLVYSNAALHWCLQHNILVPQILSNLVNKDGGVLAVQMPDTRDQPSHVLMETAALRCGFLETIKSIRIPRVNNDPTWYFKFLSTKCANVDMWTTEYIQQLPTAALPAVEYNAAQLAQSSRHPVLEYTRSTGLLPILQALGGEQDDRYVD